MFINIELAEGASLERTKEITERIEKAVEEKVPELVRFSSVIGIEGSNTARIDVTLTDPNTRRLKSYELAKDIRADYRKIEDDTKAFAKDLKKWAQTSAGLTPAKGGPVSNMDLITRFI